MFLQKLGDTQPLLGTFLCVRVHRLPGSTPGVLSDSTHHTSLVDTIALVPKIYGGGFRILECGPCDDRLRVGWFNGFSCESRRFSRDTCPETHITKYTGIRRIIPFGPFSESTGACQAVDPEKRGTIRTIKCGAQCNRGKYF